MLLQDARKPKREYRVGAKLFLMSNENQEGVGFIPCSVKMLPKEQWHEAAATAIDINPLNALALNQFAMALPNEIIHPAHLIVLIPKYWGNEGVHLTVGFVGDQPAELRALILSHMNAWSKYANVSFRETSKDPQVRIATKPGDGHWSYLGTDILHIEPTEPTMNLDGFTMNTPASEFFRVVRHETGHTLGFAHEHMRKEIVEKIDEQKAIDYFKRTQDWSPEEVIRQVLTPLRTNDISASPVDTSSIMCYWLPGSIMNDGKGVPGGTDINAIDADFAARIYPKSGTAAVMESARMKYSYAPESRMYDTGNDIKYQVKDVLSRITGRLIENIADDARLQEDLLLTTLEIRSLAIPFQYIARQYRAGARIGQDECLAQNTVQDCVDLIVSKI